MRRPPLVETEAEPWRPLAGLRVVSLAVNVPGPVAAARLAAMGAEVTKIEPPAGDPLARLAAGWYRALAAGQTVVCLDLKTADGRASLETRLARADVLLTATRPASLERLGLGWPALGARHRQLCHVRIVGEAGDRAEVAGHDLTYQAALGLLDPPRLPRTLLADLAGAERAVSAALALLVARARTGEGGAADVGLVDALRPFADPLLHGATTPAGPLGGALATYALYAAADGWVAVAALEPHFAARLAESLAVPPGAPLDAGALAAAFRARPAREWARWAEARDLPIVAVA